MIKSGAFKSTKQMVEYLGENKLLKKGLLLWKFIKELSLKDSVKD
jgi:hypothetical protein